MEKFVLKYGWIILLLLMCIGVFFSIREKYLSHFTYLISITIITFAKMAWATTIIVFLYTSIKRRCKEEQANTTS